MSYTPGDKFAQRAREQGYRARSSYKLLDIQQKFRLIRKGDVVLDLGAAPGSWMQVSSRIVGPKGRVVGVDTAPMKPLGLANAEFIQKDVFDQDLEDIVTRHGKRAYAVVLSDMAPSTSGMRERDQLRSFALAERAFEVAYKVLKKGGHAAVKIFEGPDVPAFMETLRSRFLSVKLVKPAGSRKGSMEAYIIVRNLRQSKFNGSP